MSDAMLNAFYIGLRQGFAITSILFIISLSISEALKFLNEVR